MKNMNNARYLLGALAAAACSTSLPPNSFSPASLMKLNNPIAFSLVGGQVITDCTRNA